MKKSIAQKRSNQMKAVKELLVINTEITRMRESYNNAKTTFEKAQINKSMKPLYKARKKLIPIANQPIPKECYNFNKSEKPHSYLHSFESSLRPVRG